MKAVFTTESIKKFVLKMDGYRIADFERGLIYNNFGYLAVYSMPDWEKLAEDVNDRIVEYPPHWGEISEEDMEGIVDDELHEYFIHSQG